MVPCRRIGAKEESDNRTMLGMDKLLVSSLHIHTNFGLKGVSID
jgi:hypothetical protein